MLIVATFRDSEADVPSELADTLVDVYRTEGVTRVRLGGLSEHEIREFVRLATGVEPTSELASTVHELTGGNAFLVTELWRELVGSGAVEIDRAAAHLARPAATLGTPKTVREVVSQRLAGLTREANTLLELAAVIGSDFELDVARRTAVLDEPTLLDAVDEAVRFGLLVEEPGLGLTYRFAHELVRRAVIERLSAPRTAELHLRIAESLEARLPKEVGTAALSALAYHYAAAAAVGGIERAIEFSLLAADAAIRALAFDEAADRLRTVLELGAEDSRDRAAVMLRLGDASHRAGNAGDALEAFAATAELARALDDAQLLARAAIGFEEACWRPAIHDRGAVEMLEEAAAALDPGDSDLRARMLGGLARALEVRGDQLRAARARDESIAMSRRLDDKPSLGATLAAAYWSRGVSTNDEVKGMLTEARELGVELGDAELQAEAASWLVPTYVVLCDHDRARDALRELFALTERLNEPFRNHVAEHYAAALALCDGDLAAAESAARRSHDWGRLLTGRDASGTYGIQMFGVRREQGRLAELAPAVRLLGANGLFAAIREGLSDGCDVVNATQRRESEAMSDAPDFPGLRATFVNCTLKKSPEPSHTQGLVDASAAIMRKHGVEVDVVRLVDHDVATGVYPDMREHGWETDAWPDLYPGILASDILVVAGPIWLGDNSSVTKQLIERLYSHSGELNEKGQYLFYGRVAGCLITGNEDGIKHCAQNVLYSLQHIGYTVPPNADAGWIGEAGPGPSYLDPGSGGPENDFTNRNTTFMTWNLMHLAQLLKDAGGVPGYGNQRSEWDAGTHFDFENPEYRS